jgi:bis(5'-adenosyl)-triphosphatase
MIRTFLRMSKTSTTSFFGPWSLPKSQVFFESELTLAFVNIKPILPGHVLVIPKRVVSRFQDLTSEEVTDLWSSVHKIGPTLERHLGCSAMNLAIQDGRDSGQSVAHVHVHILPRKAGDFKRNDDIYEKLEQQNLHKELEKEKEKEAPVDPEVERKPRSAASMAEEAIQYRTLFPENSVSEKN